MRLEITRDTDLAIRAMETLLANDGNPVAGKDLAAAIGTSTHRVAQVMRPLIGRYWVASTPGPRGGYRLDIDLERVSLLELIEAVEGPVLVDRCVLRGAPCPALEPCALHQPWTRARQALLSELDATPMSGVADRARNGGG